MAQQLHLTIYNSRSGFTVQGLMGSFMKVSVVGTGYMGVVTGTCLAKLGNDVVCLDVDPAKIQVLMDGGMPIYEPSLQDLVRRNMAAERLHFTTDVTKAVQHGIIQFIAVGTPPGEDGSTDLLRHALSRTI